MSPSAEPAQVAADALALAAAERLEDGEIIILAVKPSRWFVLLVSWPVLGMAGAVAVACYVADRAWGVDINVRLVALVCTAAACSRVTVACLQWLGRLYVLTNRRVMRFHGILREDFRHCPLRKLRGVQLTASPPERVFGAGTLWFQRDPSCPGGEVHWTCLAQPAEAERLVREAWSKAR